MSDNGKLRDDELTPIYGVQLANVTARAYLNMSNACFAETGRSLSIALPAGGYRSFWLQGDMRTNPNRWTLYKLNPFSVVPLASPGHSNHGRGVAVDVANWSTVSKWVLANMGRFGFTRPFGIRDPNHLLHDGSTTGPGTLTPASTNKTPLEDTLSAAEVQQINENTNQRAQEVKATLANIEKLLAVGDNGKGGIRGGVDDVKASVANVEKLLAVENNGGIRGLVSTSIGLLQRIAAKLGA
jgi:hypothetical protein